MSIHLSVQSPQAWRWYCTSKEGTGRHQKLPSLTCHVLLPHLATSFPSPSTSNNHSSPLWLWCNSPLSGFKINVKRVEGNVSQGGQLQPSLSPSLQAETLQPAIWISTQPAAGPAHPMGAGRPACSGIAQPSITQPSFTQSSFTQPSIPQSSFTQLPSLLRHKKERARSPRGFLCSGTGYTSNSPPQWEKQAH